MALAAVTGVPGTTAAPRARDTTQTGTSRPTTLPGRGRGAGPPGRPPGGWRASPRPAGRATRTRKPTSAAMAPGRPSDPVSSWTTEPARCQSAVGSNGRDSTFTKPKSSTVSMVSTPSTAPAAVARTIPTRAGSTSSSAAPSTASSGRCSAAGPTAPGWPGRTRAASTRAPANPVSDQGAGPDTFVAWCGEGNGRSRPETLVRGQVRRPVRRDPSSAPPQPDHVVAEGPDQQTQGDGDEPGRGGRPEPDRTPRAPGRCPGSRRPPWPSSGSAAAPAATATDRRRRRTRTASPRWPGLPDPTIGATYSAEHQDQERVGLHVEPGARGRSPCWSGGPPDRRPRPAAGPRWPRRRARRT